MHRCGSGNIWKWPKNPDCIYYEKKDIICTINPPKIAGSCGQFTFDTSF